MNDPIIMQIIHPLHYLQSVTLENPFLKCTESTQQRCNRPSRYELHEDGDDVLIQRSAEESVTKEGLMVRDTGEKTLVWVKVVIQ